ncbi:23S rRNA (uracil-5-)-methyltransferase RumA [Clostridia bacterium]|nr:23S rRNA (uracil-5-)-methyltransferase RumA [Clostridia bacterium]
MKCGDVFEAEIAGFTHEGVPIAKIYSDSDSTSKSPPTVVFTDDGVTGDRVRLRVTKVGRRFVYAKTAEIVAASPMRIECDCPAYARGCGGCDFRCADYDCEVQFKAGLIRHNFRRFESAEFLPFLRADTIAHYRNKAQYKFSKNAAGEIIFGFYARGSHRVVTCDSGCRLQPPVFGEIAAAVSREAARLKLSVYDETARQGVLRGLFLRQGTGGGITAVLCVKRNVPELKKIAAVLAGEHGVASVIANVSPAGSNTVLGEKDFVLRGVSDGSVTEKLTWAGGEINLAAPYKSFLQVNTAQCEKLYGAAYELAGLKAGGVIADLYCGIGSAGLYMAARAKGARVVGVDIVQESIAAAEKNAAANGVTGSYKACDAEDCAGFIGEKTGGEKIGTAVFDPARKGVYEKTLAEVSARVIIYISCNPATAARDCEILETRGYRLKKIQGCDMFPRTRHVECVLMLERE